MQYSNTSWRETLTLLKADFRRRLLLEDKAVTWLNAIGLLFKPGGLAVAVYRLSSQLYANKHRVCAQILHELQHIYSGIELHAGSIIGPGLVVGDRPGSGIARPVTVGKNCTLLSGATISVFGGVERGNRLEQRTVLGDYCIVGPNVRIIGAITIADGTQIKSNAVVLSSSRVPGAVLSGIPAVRRRIVAVDMVAEWNPLRPWLAGSSQTGSYQQCDPTVLGA